MVKNCPRVIKYALKCMNNSTVYFFYKIRSGARFWVVSMWSNVVDMGDVLLLSYTFFIVHKFDRLCNKVTVHKSYYFK